MLWVVLSVLTNLNPRDCYTNLPKLLHKCIGDDIYINPQFVGYPSTPELDWTNIDGGRHNVLQNGTLIIRNAQIEDTNLYSYLVHSEETFTLTFFNLTVTACPSIASSSRVERSLSVLPSSSVLPVGPTFSLSPSKVTVCRGSQQDFKLSVSNTADKYEITWNSDAFQPAVNSDRTVATISDLQQSGWIRVTITGATFDKSIVAHIIVSDKPPCGTDASRSTESTGKPVPTSLMTESTAKRHPSTVEPTGRDIVTVSSKTTQVDPYSTTAYQTPGSRNTTRTFVVPTSSVEESSAIMSSTITPPTNIYLLFSKEPGDVEVYAGMSVNLDCQVYGRPSRIVTYWLRGNDRVSNSVNTTVHSNGTLTLHGVSKESQGTYSCIASNGPITLMTAATVTVKVPSFVGVDAEGKMYIKNKLRGDCQHIPTDHQFKVVRTYPDSGKLLAIDQEGQLWTADSFISDFEKDTMQSSSLKSVSLLDITVGPNNVLYGVNSDNKLIYKTTLQSDWKEAKVAGAVMSVTFIDRGDYAGHMIAVSRKHMLKVKTSKDISGSWTNAVDQNTKLSAVTAWYNGSVIGVLSTGKLLYRENVDSDWRDVENKCSLVSITPLDIDTVPTTPAKITDFQEELEVPTGTTVVLNCTAFGIPTPSISFGQGDVGTSVYSNQNSVQATVSEVQLIQNITLDQAGLYYCHTVNPSGADTRTVNITVYQPLVWIIEFPVYTIAYRHTDTTFTCKAEGTGYKGYTWYKDGVPQPIVTALNSETAVFRLTEGCEITCSVIGDYNALTTVTIVEIYDLPLVGLIEQTLYLCTDEGWSELAEDPTNIQYITTSYEGVVTGLDETGRVFEKSDLITKLEPQNKCCYEKISSVDPLTKQQYNIGTDIETYVGTEGKQVHIVPYGQNIITFKAKHDIESIAVYNATFVMVSTKQKLFQYSKGAGWSKLTVPMTPAHVTFSTATLQWVVNSQAGEVWTSLDLGVWSRLGRCDGAEQVAPYTITEKGPIIVSLSLPSYIIIGSTASITCIAEAYRPPTVKLVHVSRTGVRTTLREQYSSSITVVLTYTLTDVQLADAGTYHCIASNERREATETTTINVGEPPSFDMRPVSKVVTEPELITLLCPASGIPTPGISWYKDGVLVRNDKIYQNMPVFALTFTVTYDTSGIYSCKASNIHGSIIADAKVSLEDPVIIGVVEDEVYQKPINDSCTLVTSGSLYLDVAEVPKRSKLRVSGDTMVLAGLDSELYRADTLTALPTHIKNSCCVSKVVVVQDTIYAITNSNWLVSWDEDLETWAVHKFRERVYYIESDGHALYISTDGVNYKQCTEEYVCTDVASSALPVVEQTVRVDDKHNLVRFNDLSNTWEEMSLPQITTEMVSIATSPTGKVYAVGEDGLLYVRTGVHNQWHRTLETHSGFTAVEVDCRDTLWVLKNKKLFTVEKNKLKPQSASEKLVDFSTFRAGFIAITKSGKLVISERTNPIEWKEFEDSGDLISIDSYQQSGLLGVFPDGLKVRNSLSEAWVAVERSCVMKDATELISASFCNGTEPLVKLLILLDPKITDGIPNYPYHPTIYNNFRASSNVVLVCQVTFIGPVPNVYMKYQGLVIPNKQITTGESLITAVYQIPEISFDNQGLFSCYADTGTFMARDIRNITVFDDLEFTVTPTNSTSYPGGNVVLRAEATSGLPLTYTWYKVNSDSNTLVYSDTHISFNIGDLRIFDIQPAQEGEYYCVVSNGWYNITSPVVSVVIMFPSYIINRDNKQFVGQDIAGDVPVYTTAGTLDVAAYQGVLYIVGVDYKVYKLETDGTLAVLPNSCCVNSIAVYSDLGNIVLVATDIHTFKLVYRSLDGVRWVEGDDSINTVHVSAVADEIVAVERLTGDTIIKQGLEGSWTVTGVKVDMMHIAGAISSYQDSDLVDTLTSNLVVAVGHDRRLYISLDITTHYYVLLDIIDNVEAATIDSDTNTLYMVTTSGSILTRTMHDVTILNNDLGTLRYDANTPVQTVQQPKLQIIHISWQGVHYYVDTNHRVYESVAYTALPVLSDNIKTAWSMVTLDDRSLLILNKNGLRNVTQFGSTLIRKIPGAVSMKVYQDKLLVVIENKGLHYILLNQLKSGELVQVDKHPVVKLFSVDGILAKLANGAIVSKPTELEPWEKVDTELDAIVSTTLLRINSRTPNITTVAKTYYVEIGDEILMRCKATGIPTPQVTVTPYLDLAKSVRPDYRGLFQYDDTSIMETSLVTSIIVINAERNMPEWYRCEANNMYGTSLQYYKIVIWKQIEFIETPESSVVDEGKDFILNCAATALPDPVITWFKDGKPVGGSNLQLSTGGLLLTRANTTDAGQYTCRASNEQGSQEVHATVTVKRPIVYTAIPQNVTQRTGNTVELECSAIGIPTPAISWHYPNGDKVVPKGRLTIHDNGSLIITNTKLSDSMTFVCNASNQYESHALPATITIKEPEVPSITVPPKDTIVFEGQLVTLTCSASGDPKPNMYIVRDGESAPSDTFSNDKGVTTATLVLSITAASQGTYHCIAVNQRGEDKASAQITVFERTEATAAEPSLIVQPSAVIVLACTVTGSPSPAVTWSFYNKELTESNKYSFAQLPHDDHTLIITPFTSLDVGEYTCKGDNELSSDSDTTSVNIQVPYGWTNWSSCDVTCGEGKEYRRALCNNLIDGTTTQCADGREESRTCSMPDCLTEPQIESYGPVDNNVVNGSTIMFTCEVSGSPPISVTWTRDGSQLSITQDITIFSFSNKYMLKLHDLQPADGGTIACTASNTLGTDSEEMELYVELLWSEWSGWSECTEQCDGGTRTRSRSCLNADNDKCSGESVQAEPCNTFSCKRSAPVIITEVDDMTAVVGSCVTLSCSAGGVPEPDISWWSGEGQLEGLDLDTDKYKISTVKGTPTTSSLTICDLTFDDAECYNCLAVNSEGVTMTTGMLMIVSPPEIVTKPADKDVVEGTFVELLCNAQGMPEPEINWKYNGAAFSHPFVLQSDSSLRFTNISADQAGLYTCEAVNSAGVNFVQAHISVTAINGNWGDWGAWSSCDKDCGEGERRRQRLCDSPSPSLSGAQCPGNANQSDVCKEQDCQAVDRWLEWSEWSNCSPDCGAGNQSRARSCEGENEECVGDSYQSRVCFEKYCPVNGGYSQWSVWSECSKECGTGNQTRTRTCTDPRPQYNGVPCLVQTAFDVRQCNTEACPVKPKIVLAPEDITTERGLSVTFICAAEGNPTPSVAWFEDDLNLNALVTTSGQRTTSYLIIEDAQDDKTFNCLAQNKAGAKLSSVELTVNKELPQFKQYPVDTSVSEDTDMALHCEVDDDNTEVQWLFNNNPISAHFTDALSLQNGTLLLQDVSMFHTGRYTCAATNDIGTSEKTAFITVQAIQGGYNTWSTWSNCSVLCGEGVQTRSRVCDSPLPSSNGMPCTGSSVQTRDCQQTECDDVAEYGEWSECSRPCDGGVRTRLVTCSTPDCPRIETEACNTTPCPVNGNYTEWSEWSRCSVTCGEGTMSRTRTCTNPRTAHGGEPCPGPQKEVIMETCSKGPCPQPTILISGPVDLTLGVGEMAEFSATYMGSPQPTIAWLANGEPVFNTSKIQLRTKVIGDMYISTMSVLDVNVSDEKVYSLILTSADRKPILDTVSLKVTLTPVIKDSSLTFVKDEGEDLTIDCEVTSRPMSFISWAPLSPRASVLANNSLFLDNLLLTDSGMYTCTALNTVGVAVKEARVTVLAIDGGLTAWSAWSDCNSTCGGGIRTRTRKCEAPVPSASGRDCTGQLEMSMKCSNEPCPVDGGYTDWSEWTPCSVSCGLGSRSKSKSCTNPAPQYNGRNCSGAAFVEQTDTCFERNCPIDGGWSDWSSWSKCSATCGGGLQSRTRGCTNPIPMFNGARCGPEEPQIEQRGCNTDVTCPEHPIVFPIADQEASVSDTVVVVCRIHANPSPTVRWMRDSNEVLADGRVLISQKKMDETTTVSKMTITNAKEVDAGIYVCLATNVAGSNLETLTLTIEDDSRGVIGVTDVVISEGDTVTLDCVAPGQAEWKLNDVTLSPGTKFRFQGNNLAVTSATVFISGQYTCEAEDRVIKHYDLNVQAVDGGVSEWSEWSTCSGNGCGPGHRSRTRACANPQPSANGKQCEEELSKSEPCNVPCLSEWSDWTPWSACSEQCNTGYQSKQRVCVSQGGDATCPGQGTEVRDCNTQPCVVDGGWGSWNSWSECSVKCGQGERVRNKECDSPAPAAGGAYCVGDGEEKEECDAGLCPTHGSWSSWKSWTPCSVTCGRGVRYRVKECNNPAPSNGGDTCTGLGLEYGECEEKPCEEKGLFSAWSEWSECSASCGSGTQTRTRDCGKKRRLKRYVLDEAVLDREERSVKCEGPKEESRVCSSTQCAEIVFSPQSTDADVGDTASFVCQVSRGNMVWKKGDVVIEDEGRVRITYRGQSSVLKISDIIAADAGQYSCTVTEGTISETASANLTVYEPPIITFSTEQQFVRLGEKVKIECIATGRPAPNIDIVPEGQDRAGNKKKVSANPTAYLVRNSLTIPYMRAEDEGVYICLASNGRGIDERMSVLSIVIDGDWSDWSDYTECSVACGQGTRSRTRACTDPAPENGGRDCAGDDLDVVECNLIPCHTVPVFANTVSTVRVTAGESVLLPISVTANPDPSLIWLTPNGPADMMNGITVLENGSLAIDKARLKDSGVYKVLATNDAGIAEFFIMLIVDGREPEYIEPLSNVTVTSGHALQLEVTAAGSPLPLLTFIRVMDSGERLVLVSQTLSREAGAVSARYSIDFVLTTDAGLYIVQAENEYGMTETRGWVNVVTDGTAAQVSILVSSPLRALSGDRVVVPVEITGVPTPTFTWTIPDNVAPDQVLIATNGTLIIPAVDIASSGEYIINVFNPEVTAIIPSDMESITIVVVGTKPEILNATSALLYGASQGDLLSFHCNVKGVPLPSLTLTGPGGVSIPVSVDVTGQLITGEASIVSPDESHSGTYILTATNKFATITEDIEVKVPINPIKAPVFNNSFESITLFHGQSHSYRPVVEGRPEPILTLNPDTESVHVNKKGIMKFKTVEKADSGVYTLHAKNSEGSAKSIIVLDVVGKVPEFIGQFPNLTLPHLVEHEIRVTAVGVPAPTLSAKKVESDSEVVFSKARLVEKNNVTTISVTLEKPRVSDSGWYIVTASNVYGTNTTRAYLNFTTVRVEPRIISGLSSAEIKEHTPLTLSVTVDGVPEPSVTMVKDGQELPLFRQSGDVMRYTYTVPAMTDADTGLYTVTAENELGSVSTQADITMDRAELPPYFIITPSGPITLLEGDTMRLVTKVGGVPEPVVTWVKADGTVPRGSVENSTLVVTNVEESDSGQYIVRASNNRGTISHIVSITVTTLEGPTPSEEAVTSTPEGVIDNVESLRVTITKPLPDEIYHEMGGDLTMYVGGVASPMQLSFRILQKDGRWTDITDQTVTAVTQLDMTQFNASVTLPNELVRASSDISVEISNVVGSDTTSTRITVVAAASDAESPYFDPAPTSKSVYPDEHVYLTTRVLGSLPLTINWYLDNDVIERSDDNYKFYTNGTLRINSIKPAMTGTYSVKALNTEGTVKESVLVNIAYAAEWSEWSSYGPCSAACAGRQVRSRSCSNPPPKDGYSNNCKGDRTQTEDCGASVCPGYSEWGDWSDCSAECGYGMRARQRACDNPAPGPGEPGCDGLAKETRACYLKACPDRVDGEWTEWTTWSDCSVSCGTGIKRRDRTCSNPLPSGGGATCEGTGHETVVCVERTVCPRGAGWGKWGQWSQCTLSCGGGTQTRERYCGQESCVGNTAQVRDCNTEDCALRNIKKSTVPAPDPQVVLYQVKIGSTKVCLPLNTSVNTQYYSLLEAENVQLYATVNEDGLYTSLLLYSGDERAKISNSAKIPTTVGEVTVTKKKKLTVVSTDWFTLKLHRQGDTFTIRVTKLTQHNNVTGLLVDMYALQKHGTIKKKKQKTLLKYGNTAYVLHDRDICWILSSTKLAANLVTLTSIETN